MNAPTVPNSDETPTTGGQLPSPGPQSYDARSYGPRSYDQQSFDQRSYEAERYRHQPSRVDEDPGKVLGIISLVATLSTFLGFNFIGPIVGIITGHMARNRSRSAGYGDNEMGKWGFILGIVFVSLAALGGLLGITFAGVAGLAGLLGS